MTDDQTDLTPRQGKIEGCSRDRQSITSDWQVPRQLIDGVHVREIKNVPGDQKVLSEIYRKDWSQDDRPVEQVFQVQLGLHVAHAPIRFLQHGQVQAFLAAEVGVDRLLGAARALGHGVHAHGVAQLEHEFDGGFAHALLALAGAGTGGGHGVLDCTVQFRICGF